MRRPMLYAAVAGSMLAASLTHLQAQSPKPPETYSFVANSAMGGPMTIKVNRNGPKEVVEMKSASSSGLHVRQLYDFQAHRVYTLDLQVNRCTTQEYASPYAPSMHDPIGGSVEMIKDIGSLPVMSRADVNGLATKVAEAALPDGAGKYKYWLDEKFSFPVKLALTMGSQPERILFEIRQLSYEPSPASVFAPPPGCTQVGGVTTATGGRAEVNVEAKASQTHQLGESGGQSGGQGAVVVQPARAGKRATVTAVRLRLVPESYTGPCPAPVQLVGDITADGPGTVWYEFLAGAVRKKGEALGTLTFSAAGTQSVTLEAEYVSTPRVPTSLIAVMADEDGKRGPQNLSSGPVRYNATCGGQASPVRR